jgi:uncharacterized protein
MTDIQPRPGMSRRSFLSRSAVAAGGSVFALTAMDGLAARAAAAAEGRPPRDARNNGGYGDLRAITRHDPVTGTPVTLELPDGFDFRIFGLAGTEMDDGNITPLGHDGMAAFAGPRGTVRLVRNHEERTDSASAVPSGRPDERYDALAGGGTSTLQVRIGADGVPTLDAVWMSLAGTFVNCAGGPTPWGSWLSCEETVDGPGPFRPDSQGRPFRGTAGWERDHGYIFEVPSSSDVAVDPVPLKAMGRFVHEAVAIDPATGIVYETEDRGTAGFYRFIPEVPGRLAEGGRLEMLKIKGAWQADTRTGQRAARALPVEWVEIPDPDPADAQSDSLAVYRQGFARGGATFGRLEGCWWGNGAVYIASTNGGDAGQGQIWEYRPNGRSDGTLRLVYESPDRAVLSFPDNLTVTPSGALLLCEDTSRSRPGLVGLTRDGRIFPFCVDPDDDEWCGATFSPDGRHLFANLQGDTRGNPTQAGTFTPGRTVAIWGPWERGVL